MSYDAAELARQLAQLGLDLQDEVAELGRLEEATVTAEGNYRHLNDLLEDAQASAFLRATGTNAEARKAEARLACTDQRMAAEAGWKAWNKLKAEVRTQQANLQAIHRRIEIGRSLLSREKSLLSLSSSGVDV